MTGGSDNHLILVDAISKGITGHQLARAMDASGIVCNRNLIPNDKGSAMRPSGVRLGTPAVTSRGFGSDEMTQIAQWIERIAAVRGDADLTLDDRRRVYREIAGQVRAL